MSQWCTTNGHSHQPSSAAYTDSSTGAMGSASSHAKADHTAGWLCSHTSVDFFSFCNRISIRLSYKDHKYYLLFLGLFKFVQLFAKTSWLKALAMSSRCSNGDNIIVLIWMTKTSHPLLWIQTCGQANYREKHTALGFKAEQLRAPWIPRVSQE